MMIESLLCAKHSARYWHVAENRNRQNAYLSGAVLFGAEANKETTNQLVSVCSVEKLQSKGDKEYWWGVFVIHGSREAYVMS